MLIKTILNNIEKFKSFVYGKIYYEVMAGEKVVVVELKSRSNSKGECHECGKSCCTYDTQPARNYEYVSLWNIPMYFRYAPRRVYCKQHGIHIEQLPWAEGKEHLTISYKSFLASWAKRLSWKEVAAVFNTSWESVYRAIKWVVDYGLTYRDWDDVTQIGVDEFAVFKGYKYLTCVDHRRLLWCGMEHTEQTLLQFFKDFGEERSARLQYVMSDMWRPYLNVIKRKAINALNILDRLMP